MTRNNKRRNIRKIIDLAMKSEFKMRNLDMILEAINFELNNIGNEEGEEMVAEIKAKREEFDEI